MVETTQEYINGAAVRFQADNAGGSVKRARRVIPKTQAERVALYHGLANECRASGNERSAAKWEQLALQVLAD